MSWKLSNIPLESSFLAMNELKARQYTVENGGGQGFPMVYCWAFNSFMVQNGVQISFGWCWTSVLGEGFMRQTSIEYISQIFVRGWNSEKSSRILHILLSTVKNFDEIFFLPLIWFFCLIENNLSSQIVPKQSKILVTPTGSSGWLARRRFMCLCVCLSG